MCIRDRYQSEQAELDEKIEQLQSAIATESQNAADAEKWIALMKECVNPTAVSYTHLDVYKRQEYGLSRLPGWSCGVFVFLFIRVEASLRLSDLM